MTKETQEKKENVVTEQSVRKIKVPAKKETKYEQLTTEITNLKSQQTQLLNAVKAINTFPNHIVVKYKKLSEDAQIPTKISKDSAGMDLVVTDVEYDYDTKTYCYHTGLAMEIPSGYVGLLFPKSSIYNQNLTLANCVGVIDADYRGEVMARFKGDCEYYKIERKNNNLFAFLFGEKHPKIYKVGEKVVQLIIVRIPDVTLQEIDNVTSTERGTNGFGQMDEQVLTKNPIKNE